MIDKITILEIKSERIREADKVANVQAELALLSRVKFDSLGKDSELATLTSELRSVNEQLWDIEDRIRVKESEKSFDAEFVELARSVYVKNDYRANIKRKINELVGSRVKEEKSYQDY